MAHCESLFNAPLPRKQKFNLQFLVYVCYYLAMTTTPRRIKKRPLGQSIRVVTHLPVEMRDELQAMADSDARTLSNTIYMLLRNALRSRTPQPETQETGK